MPTFKINLNKGLMVGGSFRVRTLQDENITTPTPTPSNPSNLNVSPDNNQLILSWTAPSYSGTSSITGYVVEYTPSGGSASTVLTNSINTSYTLTGLTNGTSYAIRVAAINSSGTGTYSTSQTQTPNSASLTVLSGLTNNGTASGAGTVTNPLVWSGTIRGNQSVFTVQASGTLYVSVTQITYSGDSVEGSQWFRNGTYVFGESYANSYSRSVAVTAGNTISVTFESWYGGALTGFSAYVN